MDIFEASAKGNVTQLRYLLDECPTDVDERNWMWQTPLIIACIHNQYLAAKLLIERGADVLVQDHESGWTPLHHCMYRGHFAVGSLIVKARRDNWTLNTPPLTPMKMPSMPPILRKRSSLYVSQQRKQKFKRGTIAMSRHGFKFLVESPLEIEDYNGMRPYDLVSSPCIHGGLFSVLRKKRHGSKTRGPGDSKLSDILVPRYHHDDLDGFEESRHEEYEEEKGIDYKESEEDERYVNLVYSFGLGTNYQLGYSTQQTHQVKPQRIINLDDLNITRVATDLHGSFAITKEGSCYSWGLGMGGRLGLENRRASKSGAYQVIPKKMAAFGDKSLKNVATHGELGAALSSGGSLYVWGTLQKNDDKSSSVAGGTPEKNLKKSENEAKNKVVFGNVPVKLSISVKFTTLSVSQSRICLVTSNSLKVYMLGRCLTENRVLRTPTVLQEYTNVKSAVATENFILVLTHSGEVLQQDQDVRSYHRISFPKGMGFEKQASVHMRNRSKTNCAPTESHLFCGGNALAGIGSGITSINVHITSICANPGGSHALAVSNLGNAFAWTFGAQVGEFPIPNSTHSTLEGSGSGIFRSHSNRSLNSSPSLGPVNTALTNDSPFQCGKAKVAKRRRQRLRTCATLVPGLSRVFVTQASIASKHAAVVTRDGDLYTWGSGCIGHGKQTVTPVPTRVHRLRQVNKVQVAGGHTLAVQRIKVPRKLTSEFSSLIYDDAYALLKEGVFPDESAGQNISKSSAPSLQRLCELSFSDLVTPTSVFKFYKMALGLKIVRLVKFCARYIMLNHRYLIPLALKMLTREELQQLDFYYFLWSTDPYLRIDAKLASTLCYKFPSHLHPGWLLEYSKQVDDLKRASQEVDRKQSGESGGMASDLVKRTTPKLSPRAEPIGQELLEIVTAEDGKKHCRVTLRVKKRFKELRKKLKQIQSLKSKIAALSTDQQAKVDLEPAYRTEFKGLKKVLKLHQAGRDFLERVKVRKPSSQKDSSPTYQSRTPVRRMSISQGYSPESEHSNGIESPFSSEKFQVDHAETVELVPFSTPKAVSVEERCPKATSAPAGQKHYSHVDKDSRPTKKRRDLHRTQSTKVSRALTTFELIQMEQRKELDLKQKAKGAWGLEKTSRQLFPKNELSKSVNPNPWQSQMSRKARRMSPPVAPSPDSMSSISPSFEAMSELQLPDQLQLSDFILPKAAFKLRGGHASLTQKNRPMEQRQGDPSGRSARIYTTPKKSTTLRAGIRSPSISSANSWSLFEVTSGKIKKTPTKSLLEIQREQQKISEGTPKNTSMGAQTRQASTGSAHALKDSKTLAKGSFSASPSFASTDANIYAPPPSLSLSDAAFMVVKSKKKGKKSRALDVLKGTSPSLVAKAPWNSVGSNKRHNRDKKAAQQESSNGKSFMEIMKMQAERSKQHSQHHPVVSKDTGQLPAASAWARDLLPGGIQNLEAIQTQQLAEALTRQEEEENRKETERQAKLQKNSRRNRRRKKQQQQQQQQSQRPEDVKSTQNGGRRHRGRGRGGGGRRGRRLPNCAESGVGDAAMKNTAEYPSQKKVKRPFKDRRRNRRRGDDRDAKDKAHNDSNRNRISSNDKVECKPRLDQKQPCISTAKRRQSSGGNKIASSNGPGSAKQNNNGQRRNSKQGKSREWRTKSSNSNESNRSHSMTHPLPHGGRDHHIRPPTPTITPVVS